MFVSTLEQILLLAIKQINVTLKKAVVKFIIVVDSSPFNTDNSENSRSDTNFHECEPSASIGVDCPGTLNGEQLYQSQTAITRTNS